MDEGKYHCLKCNEFKEVDFFIHCEKCDSCVVKSFEHCEQCNKCVDKKGHSYCGEEGCNKCVNGFNSIHCNDCKDHVYIGLKHCEECNKCVNPYYIHCKTCGCKSKYYVHCPQCDECVFRGCEIHRHLNL